MQLYLEIDLGLGKTGRQSKAAEATNLDFYINLPLLGGKTKGLRLPTSLDPDPDLVTLLLLLAMQLTRY